MNQLSEKSKKLAQKRILKRKERNRRILLEQKTKREKNEKKWREGEQKLLQDKKKARALILAKAKEEISYAIEEPVEEENDSFRGLEQDLHPVCWGLKVEQIIGDPTTLSPIFFTTNHEIDTNAKDKADQLSEQIAKDELTGLKIEIERMFDMIKREHEVALKLKKKSMRAHKLKVREVSNARAIITMKRQQHHTVLENIDRLKDAIKTTKKAEVLYKSENALDDAKIELRDVEAQLKEAQDRLIQAQHVAKEAEQHKLIMTTASEAKRKRFMEGAEIYNEYQNPPPAQGSALVALRSVNSIDKSKGVVSKMQKMLGIQETQSPDHPATSIYSMHKLPSSELESSKMMGHWNPELTSACFWGFDHDRFQEHSEPHVATQDQNLYPHFGFEVEVDSYVLMDYAFELDPHFQMRTRKTVQCGIRSIKIQEVPKGVCSICMENEGSTTGCPGCWKPPFWKDSSQIDIEKIEHTIGTNPTMTAHLQYKRGTLDVFVKAMPGGPITYFQCDPEASVPYIYHQYRSLGGSASMKQYINLVLPTMNGLFLLDPFMGVERSNVPTHKDNTGALKLKEFNLDVRSGCVVLFDAPRNAQEAMVKGCFNYIRGNCRVNIDMIKAIWQVYLDDLPKDILGDVLQQSLVELQKQGLESHRLFEIKEKKEALERRKQAVADAARKRTELRLFVKAKKGEEIKENHRRASQAKIELRRASIASIDSEILENQNAEKEQKKKRKGKRRRSVVAQIIDNNGSSNNNGTNGMLPQIR
eukprot:TRINITY_DN23282_c0_g1_i2.p1 TRINITY_DN23282_c0_g1~~TRINITY_DN23282_c0_g1_i2.p1  ORF type:complete len:759 (-),score=194.02 TRINITY_DN23282_c0_g1_i2:120-2396(-)